MADEADSYDDEDYVEEVPVPKGRRTVAAPAPQPVAAARKPAAATAPGTLRQLCDWLPTLYAPTSDVDNILLCVKFLSLFLFASQSLELEPVRPLLPPPWTWTISFPHLQVLVCMRQLFVWLQNLATSGLLLTLCPHDGSLHITSMHDLMGPLRFALRCCRASVHQACGWCSSSVCQANQTGHPITMYWF